MGFPYAAYRFIEHTNLIGGISKEFKSDEDPRCLMLGRAKMTLTEKQIKHVVNNTNESEQTLTGWADDFLYKKGFSTVDSLDNSDFESASIVWNLNKPFESYKGDKEIDKYHLILDYGTSEHVFSPAMSVYNMTRLTAKDGLINIMLPVCGWVDHGFYQFSPSFFYAVDTAELSLEKLYFWVYDRESVEVDYWDGLSDEFIDHVDGAFDGSFLANCMEFLDRPIMAWAVLRKNDNIDHDRFMYETQQPIYKKLWDKKVIENSEVGKRWLEIYLSEDKDKKKSFVEELNKRKLRL